MMKRADDERILTILHLRQNTDTPVAEIRRRFRLTNGQMQGIMTRFTRQRDECLCAKPENKDGGMPEMWWANG